MVPVLWASRTLKDSRMLWRRAGGIWVRGSPEVVCVGAGRFILDVVVVAGIIVFVVAGTRLGVGFVGRRVGAVEELVICGRVGEVGRSGVVVVPRVESQAGGGLFVVWRSGVLVVFSGERPDGVEGFRGELVGVVARTVEGEGTRGELGRRKGEVRGLLKERGDGLYGVGVPDMIDTCR